MARWMKCARDSGCRAYCNHVPWLPRVACSIAEGNSCYQRSIIPLALTLICCLFIPVQGQTQTVLVSNWSQSTTATSMVDDERLQSFTTGSHSDGYVLTRVDLDFVLDAMVDSFTLHLWTMNGDRPGNRIAILETSAVAIGNPTEFTPSSPVILEPSTQYFIHIAVTDPNQVLILKATKSGAEDRSNEATSWQIADNSISVPGVDTSAWITETNVVRIRIFGYERDSMAPS